MRDKKGGTAKMVVFLFLFLQTKVKRVNTHPLSRHIEQAKGQIEALAACDLFARHKRAVREAGCEDTIGFGSNWIKKSLPLGYPFSLIQRGNQRDPKGNQGKPKGDHGNQRSLHCILGVLARTDLKICDEHGPLVFGIPPNNYPTRVRSHLSNCDFQRSTCRDSADLRAL